MDEKPVADEVVINDDALAPANNDTPVAGDGSVVDDNAAVNDTFVADDTLVADHNGVVSDNPVADNSSVAGDTPVVSNIRVAIADDQMLFRKGMIAIVNDFAGIELVLEADNGQALLDALATMQPLPDVALLDLSMPGLNGVETTKFIRDKYPDLRVIILSVYAEDRFVMHLMELGVNAYLFKNVEPLEVEKAIRAVVEKEYYFNAAFLRAMKSRMLVKKPRRLLTENLPSFITLREAEVLWLICKQFTATEIADKLSLSIRTVEGHRSSLLEKTASKNIAGLVLFAMKNQLLDPSDVL